jgi:hypothetical protein
MATIKKAIPKAQRGKKVKPTKKTKPSLLEAPKFGENKSGLAKLPEPDYSGLNILNTATKQDSINYKKGYNKGRAGKGDVTTANTYEEYVGNREGKNKGPLKNSELKYKTGGAVKKKMKNGGSLSGLTASNKRAGSEKGAWITVQNKALAGAKGKASLTKDKQLGATKMTAKAGKKVSKKK